MKYIVLGDESPMTLSEMPWTFILAIIHSSNHHKKGKKRSFTDPDPWKLLKMAICVFLSSELPRRTYLAEIVNQQQMQPAQPTACTRYCLCIPASDEFGRISCRWGSSLVTVYIELNNILQHFEFPRRTNLEDESAVYAVSSLELVTNLTFYIAFASQNCNWL